MTTELAGTVQVQAEVDLDALIAILDAAFFELPEQALRTCQAHRELVTPRLIEVLQEVVRLGREGIVREGNAHFFALFLLTEFESTEALPVILELYSLTDSVLENLLGDAITDSTRRFLAVLAADEPDRIEALIGNRQINEYVRWEAAGALCNLVRDGRMPRDEAVRRLAGQMRAAIAAEDGWGVTVTISELGFLNPLELQEEIQAAFDLQLVDEPVIGWKSFQRHLQHSVEPGQCLMLSDDRPSQIADTVEELRDWYCFSEEYRRKQEAWKEPEAERAPEEWYEDGGDELEDEDGDWPIGIGRVPVPSTTVRNETQRIGRNEPCPCGSGKKYKKCCLRGEVEF